MRGKRHFGGLAARDDSGGAVREHLCQISHSFHTLGDKYFARCNAGLSANSTADGHYRRRSLPLTQLQEVETPMAYIFKGTILGALCRDCIEPLAGLKLRFYRLASDRNVTALAVAAPKDTFTLLDDDNTVEARRPLQLGEAEIDERGNFSFEFAKGYDGGPFEVDLYCARFPASSPARGRRIRCSSPSPPCSRRGAPWRTTSSRPGNTPCPTATGATSAAASAPGRSAATSSTARPRRRSAASACAPSTSTGCSRMRSART